VLYPRVFIRYILYSYRLYSCVFICMPGVSVLGFTPARPHQRNNTRDTIYTSDLRNHSYFHDSGNGLFTPAILHFPAQECRSRTLNATNRSFGRCLVWL